MAAYITDDIAPYDLSRFTTSLTKNILDKNDGKHYDGSRNGLRRWYKATIEALDALGLDVDEVIRDPDFEDYEDEEFDEDVSVPDRKFIYNAVGATLTSSAKEEAENDNQNGLKLITGTSPLPHPLLPASTSNTHTAQQKLPLIWPQNQHISI